MDMQVHESAAGAFHIPEPAAGEAAHTFQAEAQEFAVLSAFVCLADGVEALIKTQTLSDHEQFTGIVRGLDHLIAVFYIQCHGLFAQHIEAVLHGAAGVFAVQIGGQTDIDIIQIRLAFDQVFITFIAAQGVHICLAAVAKVDLHIIHFELGGIDIAHSDQFHILLFAVLGGMTMPHSTEAQDRSLQHFLCHIQFLLISGSVFPVFHSGSPQPW